MAYINATTMHDYARTVADSIISDARTIHGPVVWITGNSYMPPMRSIDLAEEIWQADNNDDGELWASFVELVEGALDRRGSGAGVPRL